MRRRTPGVRNDTGGAETRGTLEVGQRQLHTGGTQEWSMTLRYSTEAYCGNELNQPARKPMVPLSAFGKATTR
jgi:hypothetical protein